MGKTVQRYAAAGNDGTLWGDMRRCILSPVTASDGKRSQVMTGHKQPERDVGEPLMLTYREAAKKIGISLRWLYVLMQKGEIRSLNLGGNVRRIRLSECEAYVDRLEAGQISEAS